jgi:hypothetical protein
MPTPKGRLVAKDYVRFFRHNRSRMETLLSSNPANTEFWEVLFELRFNNLPQPGQAESYRVRRGSTDPRWEKFLHKEQALRIVYNLRCLWLRKGGL